MKKLIYLSLLAILAASCSEEEIPSEKPTPTPGQDVIFSSTVTATAAVNPNARTTYADEAGNGTWRVNWLNGDQINVYTPQGLAGFQQAPYRVVNTTATGEDDNTLNYAIDLALVKDAGVRWGENTDIKGDFYAVYPYAEGVTNFDHTGTTNVVVTAPVAAEQVNSVAPYTNAATNNIFVKGDMPNNVMYAATLGVDNGTTPVNLGFHPVSTVLQFNLGCLSVGASATGATDQEITIRKITVESPTGMPIAGDLKMTFDNSTTLTDVPVVTVVNGTNSVSLQTRYNGTYVTIPAGGTMTANLFIAVPSATTYSMESGWNITVEAIEGTFTKELTHGDGNFELHPGEIHQITLPKFNRETEWTYETNNWMASIPSSVYVSELSLPGAWYAGSTEAYQATSDIATLYDAGVRAFGVETRTTSTDVATLGTRYVPSGVVISGTGNNSTGATGHAYYNGTSISNVITSIANKVAGSDEFAVLVLSYADGGSGGHRDADHQYWLQGIYDVYNSLSSAVKNNIYSDAITPNTTIEMVKGKLILKVNVDSRIPVGGSGTITGTTIQSTTYNYAYNNNLPGLLSYTDLTWETANNTKSLISQMYWSTWANDYRTDILNNDIANASPANLYWNYSVANRTAADGTTTNIPTYANRQASLETMMANSDVIYKQASHNVWFYFGAGGTQATSSSSDNPSPTDFATTMNPWILEQINNKIDQQKASPLGLVMCNQITNAQYHGPEIVQAIIEMNNKFYLQRDEAKASVVKSLSDKHSSAYKANVSGDGWVAF